MACPSVGSSPTEFELRRTARLLLRRPRPDDLGWMTALHADPRNYPHAPDRAHEPAQARAVSRSLLDAWATERIGYWIVEPLPEPAAAVQAAAGATTAPDAPVQAAAGATAAPDAPAETAAGAAAAPPGLPDPRVGMAGVRPSSLAGRPCFNLYFRFVEGVRGHGFAAEASREALAVATLVDPERPVVVRTRSSNEPARRLAQTLGLARRADLDEAASGFVVYVSHW